MPSIKVLDEAQVPETKSSPKRVLMSIIGALLAGVIASGFVVASLRWRTMSISHPLSLFGLELREGLAEDIDIIRKHTPEPLKRVASKLSTILVRKKRDSTAA